nr:hypothetical protein [Tanacetum cinerariifolium]
MQELPAAGLGLDASSPTVVKKVRSTVERRAGRKDYWLFSLTTLNYSVALVDSEDGLLNRTNPLQSAGGSTLIYGLGSAGYPFALVEWPIATAALIHLLLDRKPAPRGRQFALDARVTVELPGRPYSLNPNKVKAVKHPERMKIWVLRTLGGSYQLLRSVNPAVHITAHDTTGRAARYARAEATLRKEHAQDIVARPFTIAEQQDPTDIPLGYWDFTARKDKEESDDQGTGEGYGHSHFQSFLIGNSYRFQIPPHGFDWTSYLHLTYMLGAHHDFWMGNPVYEVGKGLWAGIYSPGIIHTPLRHDSYRLKMADTWRQMIANLAKANSYTSHLAPAQHLQTEESSQRSAAIKQSLVELEQRQSMKQAHADLYGPNPETGRTAMQEFLAYKQAQREQQPYMTPIQRDVPVGRAYSRCVPPIV